MKNFINKGTHVPYDIIISPNTFFSPYETPICSHKYILPDEFPELKYVITINSDDNDYGMEDMED